MPGTCNRFWGACPGSAPHVGCVMTVLIRSGYRRPQPYRLSLKMISTLQPVETQHTAPHSYPPHSSSHSESVPHQTHEKVVSRRDLFLTLQRINNKGGSNKRPCVRHKLQQCLQMEEGTKDNFSDPEIVRSVLRIIKPANFKDMLIKKDDITVANLKGFLQSHLGEKHCTYM